MQQEYTNAIGLMGGVAILAFAGLQTVTIVDKNRPQYHIRHIAGRKGPFLIGLSFTALNPFFIIWWFTAGLKLITDSEEFGITTGLILLFAAYLDGLCLVGSHRIPFFKGIFPYQFTNISSHTIVPKLLLVCAMG